MKKTLVSLATMVALATGGLLPSGPAAAAGPGVASAAACAVAGGAESMQCSGGVWPTARCRELLVTYRTAYGYPNAYCEWHLPLQAGYEELFY